METVRPLRRNTELSWLYRDGLRQAFPIVTGLSPTLQALMKRLEEAEPETSVKNTAEPPAGVL
jgi:hypothetical protein